MRTMSIKVMRIYVTESSGLLNKIINYLKTEAKIRGVTVFRGISGYGESGEHNSSLLDLSMDLPLIVEFFDTEEKILKTFEYLATLVNKEHLIIYDAITNN